MPDADHAGLRCASELLNKLAGERRVRWVKLKGGSQPTGYPAEELNRRLFERGHVVGPESESSLRIKERLESGDITPAEAIVSLVSKMQSLQHLNITPETWSPDQLERIIGKLSSGERAVAQFILHVWNPNHEWGGERFDIMKALSVWDKAHRKVFLEWAREPWWP
jgi:hypothetical protein